LYRLLKATTVDWPSTPPASVAPPQVKLPKPSASVMLLPATPEVVAVTVTPAPLETALTPTVAPVRLMASARFVASAVVEDEMEKFAPVSKPFTPPPSVKPDQVKPLGIFSESAIVLPAVPSVAAVTVTTLALEVEPTPTVAPLR